jgi:integrase
MISSHALAQVGKSQAGSKYSAFISNRNSGQRTRIRKSAIHGDQSSLTNRYTASGLRSQRWCSIAKLTRRIGQRTPQLAHIQSMTSDNEGGTPALRDRLAHDLIDAPPADTLKGVRDRAIMATLHYHDICREELCRLRVKDLHSRRGVLHFRVEDKHAKIRFVPVNAAARRRIERYLKLAGHGGDRDGALFRPVKNPRTGRLDRPLNASSINQNVVRKYRLATGITDELHGLYAHVSARDPATQPEPTQLTERRE